MAKTKSGVTGLVEYALLWLLLRVIQHAPLPVAKFISHLAARALDVFVPKLRRVALSNLAFALPDADPAHITNEVFASVGRVLLAVAKLPTLKRANIHDWIAYEGLEHYLAAKAKGRGVLVATAHFGNWELSAYAHALMTESMDIVVRPLDNERVDSMIETRRMGSGNRVFTKKNAARKILAALKDNRAVGVLIDQNTAMEEGVFVEFFGKHACANAGFVKLAHHSGAPVVPGFALWDAQSRQYTLRFYPEIPMTGDVASDTQRLHSFLEQEIRRYPGQWIWIHRRWKTQPSIIEPTA